MPRAAARTDSVRTLLERLRGVAAPLKSAASRRALDTVCTSLSDRIADGGLQPRTRAAIAAELVRIVDATRLSPRAEEAVHPLVGALALAVMTGCERGDDLVIRAARAGFIEDSEAWFHIFAPLTETPARAAPYLSALADPLPEGALALAFLDVANTAIDAGLDVRHPFDTDAGLKVLTRLARSRQTHLNEAAAATLPFIARERRLALTPLILASKDPDVRLGGLHGGGLDGDRDALGQLSQLCLQLRFAAPAKRALTAAGRADLIPPAALRPEVDAAQEFIDWLADPMEAGRPPDHLELFDTRTLYWPPTRDTRQVFLFRYAYYLPGRASKSGARRVEHEGIGMTGSSTFSLDLDNLPNPTPEQIYGMHCTFELALEGDRRVGDEPDADLGWKLISAGR